MNKNADHDGAKKNASCGKTSAEGNMPCTEHARDFIEAFPVTNAGFLGRLVLSDGAIVLVKYRTTQIFRYDLPAHTSQQDSRAKMKISLS